jgi:large subunit ribosomal protein L20
MPRVKRGTTSLKHRKNLLRLAKGYRFGRSSKERMAGEAVIHAGAHALKHRRMKKRLFRGLWNTKISAGAKSLGTSYSKLIGNLKKKNILLNRKVLSEIAETSPEAFKEIVQASTK